MHDFGQTDVAQPMATALSRLAQPNDPPAQERDSARLGTILFSPNGAKLFAPDCTSAWSGPDAASDLLTPGEGPVMLDIMDGPVTATRVTTNTLLEVSDFADGFYAALAADDEATLDRLAGMDVQLLRMAGVFPEEYSFHWARALQGFHLGAPWAVEACMAALRESAPERLRNGPASTADMFFKSSLEMELMVATASDPAQFDAVLLKSLQNHRRYFEEVEPNPGEDQSDNPLGFIALGPTAFAAAMLRRGWPITARSDYLPRCVLSP